MKVYFISGIGADKRLFSYIELPPAFEPEYIEWILPGEKESLSAYAIRLFTPYYSDKPFILIGLSLGGIVAVEIAKQFPPVCTVIINSVPVSSQLPPYYKLARKMNLQRHIPAGFFKITATLKNYFFMKSWTNKKLMWRVIRDGNSRFIKWGMNAVLSWKNEVLPSPLNHIHGTRDEVFPVKYAKPTHVIHKGGHMLVLNHAEAINKILQKILLPYQGD
jgi:pimeloyl-ACP methyl ester carboxylesterase